MHEGTRIRRHVVHGALFVALALVPVLALNSLATADTGASTRPGPALTEAQRECLAQQGVTRPARGADGERPTLTPEQRDALRQAAETCGLSVRGRRFALRPLTDEQRRCLAEQRGAFRAAAQVCGLPEQPFGGRGPHGGDGQI